jgi:putative spermidine/putrescine transport system permease protein
MAKALERKAIEIEKIKGKGFIKEGIPLIFRIIIVIAFIYLLVPVVIVILASLNAGSYLTFPPQGFSLKWIIEFLTSPTYLPAFLLSLSVALVTSLTSTIIGTMAAIFLTRVNFPGRGVIRSFFLTPIMLPGMVLGLSLYVYYLALPLGLSRTLPGLIIGHALVTMPYVIGTVSASLYNFDLSLEESARSLGAGPVRAFFKITLPIIKNGIMAGAIFSFIVSFGQFDISLFLSTPNLTPLPIALYISLRYTAEPSAAAAGTFAIILVTVSMIITSKLTNISRWFASGMKFH